MKSKEEIEKKLAQLIERKETLTEIYNETMSQIENCPNQFENDGLYLQESIGRVCKKLNIHAVSKSFYCDCQVPKLINVTTNCRCEKCGKRPPR